MNLRTLILLVGFSLPAGMAFAQYTEDALRFSQTEQGATARFKALGNAQTALGGDLSSLSGNPAGLGLFTRSEFSFTPEFTNTESNSVYINSPSSIQKDKAGINQFGIVFNAPQRKLAGQDTKKGLLSINFGISYNKTNNHNFVVGYGAQNPKSSFADYIASLADNYIGNGDPGAANNADALPSGSLERMGFKNYLIEYDPDGYFAATELNNTQRNTTFYSGSQGETNLGFGANFSNEFYIGGSVGFASLNFTADRTFTESGNNRTFNGQDPNFTGGKYKLDYTSGQETKGSGINLKLGFIYRPAKQVRLGFSFVSPTWYTITDTYSEGLNTSYTRSNGTSILPAYTNKGEVYDTDYSLRTPYKLNGGLAFIIGNYGLITGDVEYVDYSSINFSSSDYDLDRKTNRDIRDLYQGAVNFKLGGELKLSPVTLRAGLMTSGNPYQNAESSLDTYTAGIGYRVNNFYIDLTYANSVSKYSTKPYLIQDTYADYKFTGPGEAASIKSTRNNVYATIGLRF